ncbi:Spo0B domain-containing protein [Moorella naiadis]|uniref:Spo0B domain-containing protein n=1 Tax=Moorella naiadis (nom. illeg.) TaxID=3093670 RepID=UPI003D9C872A
MAWQAAEIIPLLRWQRHDFLNHLQVISGYIQLQKSDRALAYLRQAIDQMEQLGQIMRLLQPELALITLTRIEGATARGITPEVKIETRLENQALEPGDLAELWATAWDLALALCSGDTLSFTLTEARDGYRLQFHIPVPVTPPPPEAAATLAGRQQVPFNWQPETGDLSILLRKNSI